MFTVRSGATGSHTTSSGVVENVRAGQVDVCPRQMDFHAHGVGDARRVYVDNRLIVHGVDKPADAVRVDQAGRSDRILLHLGCAGDGGEVEVIRPVREIVDRVEVAGARL